MKTKTKKTQEFHISAEIGHVVSNDELELIDFMEKKYPGMTGEFRKLCIEQYLMFLKKQNDYGPMNIAMNTRLETEQEKKFAMTGLITRMNDKMSRLINLIVIKQGKPANESIEDSFQDISVYGKISQIVMKGKWAK